MHALCKGMAEIHVTLQNIVEQLDSIACCITKKKVNMVMIIGTVKHLNAVCTDSYYSTSRRRDCVWCKTKELKPNFKRVY